MAKKRVSIKDIAEAAGVSHPTVSRALRGQGRMSDTTRTRILTLAEEMGYTPNLIARGLVMQRTNSIGLVVTNIGDPFHSEIIRGVERVVRDNQYSLFLGSTTADPDQEMQVVRSFQERYVDGIIVSSSQVGDLYADLLNELGIPIVLINNHAEGNNIHSVSHDDYAGGRKMMEHLLNQGYRRIAYLGNEQQAGRAHQARRRAWQTALAEIGVEEQVTADAPDYRIPSGVVGTERLLEKAHQVWARPPEAIFCYNDLVAIGAINALRARGLNVPEDVAVAGFDDLAVVAYIEPALTTLHQPRYEMGIRAIEMLLTLLETDPASRRQKQPTDIHYVGELMVRRSTQIGR